jgi:probable HAF family extracellular repeat protein
MKPTVPCFQCHTLNSIGTYGDMRGRSAGGDHMRTSAAYFGALFIALSSASAALAQEACEVRDLGTLGGLGTTTRDINDQGQVVGLSDVARDRPDLVIQHAFLWEDGRMYDLGALEEGARSQAFAINDSGVVVGSSARTLKGDQVPVVWQQNTIAPLPFDGEDGEAVDINNGGQIIGNAGYSTCLLWQDADSEPTPLEGLGGEFCLASAINDAGVIVGRATTADGEERAFVWRDGVMRAAESLEHAPYEVSELYDINDAGLAIGRIGTDEASRALVWSARRGGRPLDVADAIPRAVNDWGIIALIPTSEPFTLWLGDRYGRTIVVGDGLNGRDAPEPFKFVTGFTMNNRFRAAWSVYTTGTEYDHAYTCQLPRRAARALASQPAP